MNGVTDATLGCAARPEVVGWSILPEFSMYSNTGNIRNDDRPNPPRKITKNPTITFLFWNEKKLLVWLFVSPKLFSDFENEVCSTLNMKNDIENTINSIIDSRCAPKIEAARDMDPSIAYLKLFWWNNFSIERSTNGVNKITGTESCVKNQVIDPENIKKKLPTMQLTKFNL